MEKDNFDMNEIEDGLKNALKPNSNPTAEKEQPAEQNKDVKSDSKSTDEKPNIDPNRFKSRLALENEKREKELKEKEEERIRQKRESYIDKMMQDNSIEESTEEEEPKKTVEEIAQEVYEKNIKKDVINNATDSEINDFVSQEPKLDKYRDIIKEKMIEHNLSVEATVAMLKGMGVISTSSSKKTDIGTGSNSLRDSDEVDFDSLSLEQQEAIIRKQTSNGKSILFNDED